MTRCGPILRWASDQLGWYLTNKDYVAKAREIIKGADVLVENFRGRKLAEFGLSAEAVAEMRPGIIYTSIRAFGWSGPWARGGFDMDANCCTGFTVIEGTKDKPKLPPTIVLNDYLAGYLTAMGVLAALKLRVENGGSYHVRTSLSLLDVVLDARDSRSRLRGR